MAISNKKYHSLIILKGSMREFWILSILFPKLLIVVFDHLFYKNSPFWYDRKGESVIFFFIRSYMY